MSSRMTMTHTRCEFLLINLLFLRFYYLFIVGENHTSSLYSLTATVSILGVDRTTFAFLDEQLMIRTAFSMWLFFSSGVYLHLFHSFLQNSMAPSTVGRHLNSRLSYLHWKNWKSILSPSSMPCHGSLRVFALIEILISYPLTSISTSSRACKNSYNNSPLSMTMTGRSIEEKKLFFATETAKLWSDLIRENVVQIIRCIWTNVGFFNCFFFMCFDYSSLIDWIFVAEFLENLMKCTFEKIII